MLKKYKVLLINRGKYTTYKLCETREEALAVMSGLNIRLINKAYKRAIRRGRQGIGHEAYRLAMTKTAVQY